MEHNTDQQTHHTPENTAPQTSSPAWLLPASIMVAAVLISGSLIYMTHSAPSTDTTDTTAGDEPSVTVTAPTSEERDAILGDPNAKISIVGYADFQCPFCAQYHDQVETELRRAYVETGKAKIVYRHLAFLGPESVAAAAASECAKDQNKFWEFHDALLAAEMTDGKEHNGNLNKALFVKIAKDLKLDEAKFASCVDADTHVAFVEKQTEEASAKYGVRSTPTIFVNDQKVEGAYPLSTFVALIDGMLAE